MNKLPKEREHLVLENEKLVHWVLTKQLHFTLKHDSYWDYYQQGMIGLIISAIRFDESFGFKFATFAIPNIRGSILIYVRNVEPLIKYPRRIRDVLVTVSKYKNQGYTLQEIQELTGISGEDIRDSILVSNQNIQRLEQTAVVNNDSTNLTLSDTISSNVDDFEEILSQDNILSAIEKSSKTYSSERDRGIWEEYIYSLMYGENLSQNYLAKKYETSQAQISRILKKGKLRFQFYLTEQ